MGVISPGGENLLHFLELRQVLSTYVGDHRDPSGGLRKGQSPCELLGGLSGLLWMWAGLSCFLSSGDGYAGNFLSCSKGVKDPL